MKMKHTIIRKILMLAVAVGAAVSPAMGEKITKYTNFCGTFDKVQVCDNVNVVYKCSTDSAGYVSFIGAKRFANAFIVSNSKGKLKIQVNTEDVNDPELPTLNIYSNFLNKIENSSEKRLEIINIAPCPQLTVRQIGNGTIAVNDIKSDKLTASIATGNGTIILTGSATEAKYVMVGTGLIQADLLRADVVNCRVVGSGSIGCWPDESLSVRGLGSTKVYYRGNPVIKKSPGLKIFSLDEYNQENGNSWKENASGGNEDINSKESGDETEIEEQSTEPDNETISSPTQWEESPVESSESAVEEESGADEVPTVENSEEAEEKEAEEVEITEKVEIKEEVEIKEVAQPEEAESAATESAPRTSVKTPNGKRPKGMTRSRMKRAAEKSEKETKETEQAEQAESTMFDI